MAWRISVFTFLQVAGALIGWWLGGEIGIAAGLVCGSLVWLVFDTLRAMRVLTWLRRPDDTHAPSMAGLWGEVADRARRMLRQREIESQDAQARLQEFLAAIQASPNGVVLLDAQGRIEWCNQMAADQFGFDQQRDLMQQITNLLRDPAFTAYFNSGIHDREVMIPGPGSSPTRPVKLSVHLHPYGQGRSLLLSRDVTALEQAEAMRRDFVANVSHEIRTPLTVLVGFVETLQNLPLEAQERARYLTLMAQQAQRMQMLVSDLLTLSRLEGSPMPGVGEWTPVATLMAQCEEEADALSRMLGKAHEMRFEPAPAFEIAGAASELLSALSNLVSNAVRYTPAHGSIEVAWRALPDGRGEFSVRDSGPGIAPEHIPRLTERFYRIDRSRSRETGGTGLGLAIVKHVAQRHGAELRIDSAPGAGSTFSIQFPASRVRASVRAARDDTSAPLAAGSTA